MKEEKLNCCFCINFWGCTSMFCCFKKKIKQKILLAHTKYKKSEELEINLDWSCIQFYKILTKWNTTFQMYSKGFFPWFKLTSENMPNYQKKTCKTKANYIWKYKIPLFDFLLKFIKQYGQLILSKKSHNNS